MRVGYGRQAVPRRLGFVLVFIALLPAATALAAAPGTWSPTGSLPSGAGLASREATLVPNGHVLVVHATYDPASGTWTPSNALQGLLLPNGTVLSGTSVYDPSTDTVSSTGPLPMSGYLISALLPDGRVLAVGGFYPGDPPRPNGAALYDPASNTWSRTNGLTQFRLGFSPPDSATLLPNGKILVSGGGGSGGLANAELYDPSTGTWLASSAGQTVHATAVLLANGKVLFTSLGAQLYDPATDTWSVTSGMPVDQFFPPATLLPNGTVLVAGGGFRASTDASLYDPASGTWRPTGSMTTPRIGPAQTLLRDGTTLAVGGSDGSVILTSAELYTPPTAEVVPPSCALSDAGLDSSGHAFIKVAARDIFSGLSSIQVLEATNANVALPRFPPGFRGPGVVTATKLNQAQRSTLGLQVTTLAGQTITCDPVVAQLVRQKGEPRSEVFRNIAQAESKLRVANGRPGLNKIEVLVNGTRFRLTDLHDGEVRTADVAKAMRPGKQNTITITMHGSRGSRALLVISD